MCDVHAMYNFLWVDGNSRSDEGQYGKWGDQWAYTVHK